jgi:hypothetical protein
VAGRTDLPRSLRRAADRPATPGRQPSDRLIAAAEAGIIRRSNTKKGTRGQQAANAVTYRRRTSGRPEGVSAREAAGHERPEVRAARAISVLLDRPAPFVILEGPARLEASRAARYDSYAGQLAAGGITPERFQRKISSWRPIRGERFLADPDRVLAVLEARRAGDEELFIYRNGRAA